MNQLNNIARVIFLCAYMFFGLFLTGYMAVQLAEIRQPSFDEHKFLLTFVASSVADLCVRQRIKDWSAESAEESEATEPK